VINEFLEFSFVGEIFLLNNFSLTNYKVISEITPYKQYINVPKAVSVLPWWSPEVTL